MAFLANIFIIFGFIFFCSALENQVGGGIINKLKPKELNECCRNGGLEPKLWYLKKLRRALRYTDPDGSILGTHLKTGGNLQYTELDIEKIMTRLKENKDFLIEQISTYLKGKRERGTTTYDDCERDYDQYIENMILWLGGLVCPEPPLFPSTILEIICGILIDLGEQLTDSSLASKCYIWNSDSLCLVYIYDLP